LDSDRPGTHRFCVRDDLRSRFRILLEIAAIGMRMGVYAVQPFPGKLLIYASIGGLIEMLVTGAIVGAIYKPAPVRSSSQ
jgi:hypothetical protein